MPTITIPVSRGKYQAIIDSEDYAVVSKRNWRRIAGYAACTQPRVRENGKIKRKTLFMHVLINKTPVGMQTDHINGNILDNRKENLRSVTHQQNQMNKKTSSTSSTGIKGVGWCKQTKKYKVSIFHEGKRRTLGRFDCIKKATQVYNDFAVQSHGKYARLNRST